MNTVNLSTKEIFSFGFRNAKKYFWQFFLFLVVYYVLSMIPVLNILSGLYLTLCLYSALLKISRGENVELKTFFAWPKNGFISLWTAIVSGLVAASGIFIVYIPILIWGFMSSSSNSSMILRILIALFILFGVISAFYMFIRISFARFYSLETGAGANASIKKSWEITRGLTGRIFFLLIVSYLIILLGLLAVVIGLLWAIPTAMIAYVYIYTKLLSNNEQTINPESEIIVQPTEIPANSQNTVDSNS